jgi:predicted NAD/FAD-binding protein
VKVAIVGSGIAGLSAAYALHREHSIEMFESASRLGGHVHTVRVPTARGDVAVDMGFIVFNPARYPNLCRLFDELGVASRASDMSFSVHRADTGYEYGTSGLRALFARRRDDVRPAHYRLLLEIVRFTRLARTRLREGSVSPRSTLAEWLADERCDRDVVDHFVVPLGAAIWSTSSTRMMDFPALSYLRFCESHGMFDVVGAPRWRTVVGGSDAYVRALSARIGLAAHLESPVERVYRDRGGVVVEVAGRGARRFDRCILATHADHSRAMLVDANARERSVLGAFGFSRNTAWLHTDRAFLPARRAARSSWNVMVDPASRERVAVTYWMNRLQGLDTDDDYCVTLNPTHAIPPARVITRVEFEHPLFDHAAIEAQREIPAIQGRGGVYFSGAWQRYGFHEDGAVSGLAAAHALRRGVEAVQPMETA